MKLTAILSFFLFSYLSAFSQTYEDVVYLKNGSEIHGMIMEQIPNESLKIKSGQNTFVYKMDEVQRIAKVEVSNSNQTNTNTNNSNANKPDASLAETYFKKRIDSESGGLLQFISIKKTNGQESNLGVAQYSLFYELIFQPKVTVSTSGDPSYGAFGIDWDNFYTTTTVPDAYAKQFNTLVQYFPDKAIMVTGTLNFELTDNGWAISGYSNGSQKVLSTNYFTITTTSDNILENNTNNSSASNVVLGNKTILQTNSRPFDMIDYIRLGDSILFLGNSSKLDTKLISSKVREAFTTHANLSIAANQFENFPDSLISTFKITINDITLNKESGYKTYDNSPYSGYKAKISFNINIKFGSINKVVENTQTATGGNPTNNDDQNAALNGALSNMQALIKVYISWYFMVYASDYSISDEKKNGNIKRIKISDVGQYLDANVKLEALIFTDYEIRGNSYDIKGVLAKGEIDSKNSTNSVTELKITEGENKIRPAIDDGKKLHIMFMTPAIVDYYMKK